MGSSNPDFIAVVISMGDMVNSVSPFPSTCTFFGTHATIAAGRGAVGFPKSATYSKTLAPTEFTYIMNNSKQHEMSVRKNRSEVML